MRENSGLQCRTKLTVTYCVILEKPYITFKGKDFKTLTFTVKSIMCTSTMLFLSGLESAQSFHAMAGEEAPQ